MITIFQIESTTMSKKPNKNGLFLIKLAVLFVLMAPSLTLWAQSPFEKSVLDEINLARCQPKKYLSQVKEYEKFYNSKKNMLQFEDGSYFVFTEKNAASYKETLKFLKKSKKKEPLTWARQLASSAKDHQTDMGPKGQMGHTGSHGESLSARIEKYASWQTRIGENLSYGMKTPRLVVFQMLADDGLKSKAHRKNMLNGIFKKAGIACGYHKTYETSCVIDLAGDIGEKLEISSGSAQKVFPFVPSKK